jgi:hypothetical protein
MQLWCHAFPINLMHNQEYYNVELPKIKTRILGGMHRGLPLAQEKNVSLLATWRL